MATFLYVEAPHRAVIDRLVEEYNKIDPNVQIEISGAGYADYWNNLTTEILANNETDIMQIYPTSWRPAASSPRATAWQWASYTAPTPSPSASGTV